MSEQKAKCGCWIEWVSDGGLRLLDRMDAGYWVVTATSFLCSAHRQGAHVVEPFADAPAATPAPPSTSQRAKRAAPEGARGGNMGSPGSAGSAAAETKT